MGPWSYEALPVEGGTRRTATVSSMLRLDLDGTGPRPLRLRFRDDPIGGYACFLLLEAGEPDCDIGCKLRIAVDDAEPFEVRASRPESDTPMFSLRDPRELWYRTRGARLLQIDFPVRRRGTVRVSFDIRGLDRSRLGWDRQRHAELRDVQAAEAD